MTFTDSDTLTKGAGQSLQSTSLLSAIKNHGKYSLPTRFPERTFCCESRTRPPSRLRPSSWCSAKGNVLWQSHRTAWHNLWKRKGNRKVWSNPGIFYNETANMKKCLLARFSDFEWVSDLLHREWRLRRLKLRLWCNVALASWTPASAWHRWLACRICCTLRWFAFEQ